MPRKKDITRAEAKANSRADDLRRFHAEMMRSCLRLSDDELLETWRTIESMAASKILAGVSADEYTGTQALSIIAKNASERIDAILERMNATAAPTGGDTVFIFSSSPAPPIDDSEPEE